MNLHEIEEKIRHLIEKCRQLEQEKHHLLTQLKETENQYGLLKNKKEKAIHQVEALITRLKSMPEHET